MEGIFEYRDCISPMQEVESINVYGVDKVGGKTPSFTIAIPTYKRIDTLSDTIESALSQVRFDDYNLIVVDNNPEREDETEVFMLKYLNHPRVTYYKNSQNVGMAGNWNKCALLSDADYFLLLHDDDILSPFALSVFKKVVDQIDKSWTLIKPGLEVFRKKNELHFGLPSEVAVSSLSIWDFTAGCAVGAPTCILYNKSLFLKSGGYNDSFYPCIDYVNSLNLARIGRAYTMPLLNLGGYRIGQNASLSEKTMDMYFLNNYLISKQVMKRCKLSNLVIKVMQSALIEYRVRDTLSYYGYHNYQLKREHFDLYELPSLFKKFVWLSYRRFVSFYDKRHKHELIINIK